MKYLKTALSILATVGVMLLLEAFTQTGDSVIKADVGVPKGLIVSREEPMVPNQHVELALILPFRHPNLAAELASQAGSSGRFLTPGQFLNEVGPSYAIVAQVAKYLSSLGFQVQPLTSPDSFQIDFSGDVSRVDSAFHVNMVKVEVNGKWETTAIGSPTVPSYISQLVEGLVGFSSFAHPHPNFVVAKDANKVNSILRSSQAANGSPSPCSQSQTSGYTPPEIAAAYNFNGAYNEGLNGNGQSIGVVEFTTINTSDIAAYENCMHIETLTPQVVQVDCNIGPCIDTSAQIESDLDIELLAAMDYQVSNIIAFEGPDYTSVTTTNILDVINTIVSQDKVNVVSDSWGICEPQAPQSFIQAENQYFEQAAAEGITFVAASGDSGSYGCGSGSYAVSDPASQPYVVAVGGTTLQLGPNAVISDQTVWNNLSTWQNPPNGNQQAGGGGLSMYFPMPSWQRGAINSQSDPPQNSNPCGSPSGYCRQVPDLSMDADPSTGYPIFSQGSWYEVGGTSAATPLVAATVALADQAACTRLGFINPQIYSVAENSSLYQKVFYDITQGFNGPSASSLYDALPGYDEASGWGSIYVAQFIGALVPIKVTTCSVSLSVYSGSQESFPITIQNISPTDINWSASTSASWLSLASTTGSTLLPQATTQPELVINANGLGPGQYVSTITFSSNLGTFSSQLQVQLKVLCVQCYWVATSTGHVYQFGSAQFYGSPFASGIPVGSSVVGIAATPDSHGYWVLTATGNIYQFGSAPAEGSPVQEGLNVSNTCVGIALSS